jgi:predicted CopG family antitoxin
MKTKNKKQKSITLDIDIFEKTKKQAKVESRSFSNMIEIMAKKYLNI